MQAVAVDAGVMVCLHAHPVEALQGAHAGGAHGDGLAVVAQQLVDGLAAHADILGVHLVVCYLLALHGLERACTHMEGELLAVDALVVDGGKHLGGEMQAGGGGGDAALDLRVDGLVGALVAFLGLAVQVGWDREFADSIKHLGEGRGLQIPGSRGLQIPGSRFPFEVYAVAGAMLRSSGGTEDER